MLLLLSSPLMGTSGIVPNFCLEMSEDEWRLSTGGPGSSFWKRKDKSQQESVRRRPAEPRACWEFMFKLLNNKKHVSGSEQLSVVWRTNWCDLLSSDWSWIWSWIWPWIWPWTSSSFCTETRWMRVNLTWALRKLVIQSHSSASQLQLRNLREEKIQTLLIRKSKNTRTHTVKLNLLQCKYMSSTFYEHESDEQLNASIIINQYIYIYNPTPSPPGLMNWSVRYLQLVFVRHHCEPPPAGGDRDQSKIKSIPSVSVSSALI